MSGRITVSDGRQAFLDLVAHPAFDPAIPFFVDIRAVTEVAADFKGVFSAVQAVRAEMGRFNAGSQFVVVTGEGTSFGMVRMVQQVVEVVARLRMRVVASVDEAAVLLGVSAADLDTLGQIVAEPVSPGVAPG
ncbi:MAG: hypothetical protein WAT09_08445 [Paracoccaceae bacterium]